VQLLPFVSINDRLAGASFEEPDQLLQAIDAIFQSIEKGTLERVFQEWMNRLAQYCVAVGGLVEDTQKL
jgi:DNA-binding transcriptional regulator YbjK